MDVPEVLSVREARQGLAALMKRVVKPGAEPVFIGAHRKPEVVIMSVEKYRQLVTGQPSIDNSIASARLEGLEATPADIRLMQRVASGELTTEQAIAIATSAAGYNQSMVPNLDITREQLESFCLTWHITELSVFGSVLRDDFNDQSDVDFLVVFAPDARTTLFDLVHMEAELAVVVGRPVDIVPKLAVETSRNPYRRNAILGSYEVMYAA